MCFLFLIESSTLSQCATGHPYLLSIEGKYEAGPFTVASLDMLSILKFIDWVGGNTGDLEGIFSVRTSGLNNSPVSVWAET